MTWLQGVVGDCFEDALSLTPHALEADAAMLESVKGGLDHRIYALISLAIAGLLDCERYQSALSGPLDANTASQVTQDWRKAPLDRVEQAILAFTEKGTMEESNIRQSDVQALRDAGLADQQVLSITAVVAYQNYAFRVAAALGVDPR